MWSVTLASPRRFVLNNIINLLRDSLSPNGSIGRLTVRETEMFLAEFGPIVWHPLSAQRWSWGDRESVSSPFCFPTRRLSTLFVIDPKLVGERRPKGCGKYKLVYVLNANDVCFSWQCFLRARPLSRRYHRAMKRACRVSVLSDCSREWCLCRHFHCKMIHRCRIWNLENASGTECRWIH